MIALLALHAAVGLLIVTFGRRLGRAGLLVGAVPAAATLVWLATQVGDVLDGEVVTESWGWAPRLGLRVDLRLDGFAALMVLIVAGIGLAVFAYGRRYFHPDAPALGRLAGLLTLFAGAMLGIVLADHLIVLYTCWELTSITSYLLIGNDHTSAKARAAALHALLVTVAGGLAMLAGFVVLGQAAGTYRLSEILESPPSGTSVSVGLVLILIGAATKSAQYPFHGWLPGAMAAPTPVSAYLHSATMVKAGVYLVARLAPAFAVLGFWRPLVVTLGIVTMIGGGLRALRQTDLKLLLAFGTVSQLGFMTAVFGLGTPEAAVAGSVLLLAHALFKAALFMVVGILDHQTGTRDILELPVLGRSWRPVLVVAAVSAASMAGLPMVLGFVAKEAAYAAEEDAGWLALTGLTVASALTVAYSLRFVWGAFFAPARRRAGAGAVTPATPTAPAASTPTGQERARAHGHGPATPAPPPSRAFLAPPLVLAAASVLFGVAPGLLDELATAAGRGLDASAEAAHLVLWHGVNLPLVLSAVAVAGGAALFAGRRRVAPVLAVGGRVPDSGEAYLGALRVMNTVANRTTGVVQNGSLPIYTAVVLLTAGAVPAAVLLSDLPWPGWPEASANGGHLIVMAVILGSALAAAVIRRRLSAILFLGVTGYGMAALFLVRGAPDLALTQVAIETLSTVMFVLVLRRLPDRFERKSLVPIRALRFVIAGIVAAGVFLFALVAGGNGVADPVSDEIVERAYPEGHGRNVVNVILVDFRALDTAGEISVLAAAAIGAVALARAGRRPPELESIDGSIEAPPLPERDERP